MTNGEKIEEIFPNVEISPNPYSPSVDIHIGGIMMMRVDRNWWDAEYKEPTTKNNLGVDCISRADLYNRIKKIDHDEDYECDEFGGSKITYHTCDWDEVLREIEDAPSVTPQEPKIGHWIPTYGNVKCSVCGSVKDSRDVGKATHYCDFCGAKMIEPQESEET